MARRCTLTGKGVQTGNNVSHSNRKTRRRFLPNLQVFTFYSELLGCNFYLRLQVRTMRTIMQKGGLDSFLLQARNATLTEEALRIKRKLMTKKSASSLG
jgi:large subunit ribosomal protein L28